MGNIIDEGQKIKPIRLLLYLLIFVAAPIINFIVGNIIDDLFNLPLFPPFPWNLILGSTIFMSGLALGIKSTRLLYLVGRGLPWGEAKPEDQSDLLVTTGLYSYTRNPMVLGYSLLPLGMGMMFRSLGMTFFISTLTLLINIAIVKLKEEPKLKERFGSEYEEYKKNTPFLIPKIPQIIKYVKENEYFARWASSILSVGILIILTLNHQSQKYILQWEIGSIIFVIICCIGGLAAIYPSTIMNLFSKRRKKDSVEHDDRYRGHHPTCGLFSTHIIHVYGREYCSGCLGLLIGAILAIILSLASFFIHFNNPAYFYIGVVFTIFGILQHGVDFDSPFLHLLLNTTFVLGVFFLRIGSFILNGGVIVEIYSLIMAIYLIEERITLSNLDHLKICQKCAKKTCNYAFI